MKMTWWIPVLAIAMWCVAGGTPVGAEDKPAGKAKSAAEAKGDGKVNINEASQAELMKLAGVGSSAARKIIAYRESQGPFKRPQDLEKVDGVGKAGLEKNAGRISVK
jgi:competence protein ComEA